MCLPKENIYRRKRKALGMEYGEFILFLKLKKLLFINFKFVSKRRTWKLKRGTREGRKNYITAISNTTTDQNSSV